MIGNSGLAAALTVASVMSLTFLSLLCLRCRKKAKIIHPETQIYNQQIFQRGGSRFAVTQSKPVTGANQRPSTRIEPLRESDECSPDDDSGYENITDAQTGNSEPAYVAPIAVSLYENDDIKNMKGADPAVYGNILDTPEEDDDYENSAFLAQQEDDDPDYVNGPENTSGQ
ncbi:LAT2 domain-containing protein isoform X3 [Scomber scombrus]|uniref:LAT2 domain-containing protein isoform X3 n=1 Tax=Scomber scombrus TaxID=13677 RepID=A0AAV1PPC4_SCOSC|nr:LAT2 domain-containing protein [Scomber scombrus]